MFFRRCCASLSAMKITVKKVSPDTFALNFNDVTVALNEVEIRTLLLQLTRTISPELAIRRARGSGHDGPDYRAFMRRLRCANDIGIQALLRSVSTDDTLVLLKLGEKSELLQKKLFSNMSDRSAQMFTEDLSYKFPDDMVPDTMARDALKRIMKEAKKLENRGTLIYEEDEPPLIE